MVHVYVHVYGHGHGHSLTEQCILERNMAADATVSLTACSMVIGNPPVSEG